MQTIDWAARDVAKTLGILKAKVRISSPYIGGGFGGKATAMADAALAAVAARVAGRPVKLVLTRASMANNTTHRPATVQRVRLGADRQGRILAIGHKTWSGNIPDGFPEPATIQTPLLYAGANRMTRTRLAVLDLPEGSSMRAPGETSGMMALEVAMDELAEKLGLDPVELRILNDTQVDPADPSRPFSTRQLVQALRIGAERFGWDRRPDILAVGHPGGGGDAKCAGAAWGAPAFRPDCVADAAASARRVWAVHAAQSSAAGRGSGHWQPIVRAVLGSGTGCHLPAGTGSHRGSSLPAPRSHQPLVPGLVAQVAAADSTTKAVPALGWSILRFLIADADTAAIHDEDATELDLFLREVSLHATRSQAAAE